MLCHVNKKSVWIMSWWCLIFSQWPVVSIVTDHDPRKPFAMLAQPVKSNMFALASIARGCQSVCLVLAGWIPHLDYLWKLAEPGNRACDSSDCCSDWRWSPWLPDTRCDTAASACYWSITYSCHLLPSHFPQSASRKMPSPCVLSQW